MPKKNSPSLVIYGFCTNCKKVFKAIGFKNKNDGIMELCVLGKEREKTCYMKRSNQFRGKQRI